MKKSVSRQAPRASSGRRARRWVGYIGLWAGAAAGCDGPIKVRDCLPVNEYRLLKTEMEGLEGQSEYAVLSRYGKPTDISINTRSEKEYRYHTCGDTAERVVVRFGSTGRVREVYVWR